MATKHAQKNLTVMFTDISGFTRHTESVSRDAMMKRLETHNRLLMPVVAHFEGRIVKSIGDAFLIVFESPTNAVQCGMLMQHRLRAFNADKPDDERIDIKVSLNAGEVTVTEDDVFGDAVNVAAKIEKATQPGEIYFTEAVFLAMNKSEVPNSFVKTFRPRGAESQEIKLFKVVQDEEDPAYRHVVEDTKIDEDAMRAKAAALSSTAEKEASRWRDAFEHLADAQRRSSRTIILVAVTAVLVLAGAVVGGLALFKNNETKDDASRHLTEGVRAYLAAGKIDEARKVLDAYVQKNGPSEAANSLRAEIVDATCSAVCEKAKTLLAEGKDAEAIAAVREAYPDGKPDPAAAKWQARAEAYGLARQRLTSGDAPGAREAIHQAAGGGEPTGELKVLLARADAIEAAKKALDPKGKEPDAPLAISVVSQAFGDSTGDLVALDLLGQALKVHLSEVAAREGPAKAKELADEYRRRFKNLTAWDAIRREADLGSLWAYAKDPELRRHWGRWDSDELTALLQGLRTAAEGDAEFLFRLGTTIHGVTRKNNLAIADGMSEVEAAAKLDPKVLDAHDAELFDLAMDWVQYDQSDGSFGRRVIVERFFPRAKEKLVTALGAMYGEDADARPDVGQRANAFAILAEKGDLSAIKDRVTFLREALSAFVEGTPPSLSRAHARALFSGSMTPDEYRRMNVLLRGEADASRAHEGPFGAMPSAAAALDGLAEELAAAQPTLAK